jgi:hypothetical protein
MTYLNRAAALAIAIGFTACGSSSSNPAAPVINVQPQTQVVALDQSATFSVVATGSGALSYQWSKNGAAVAGANSADYLTTPAAYDDDENVYIVTVSDSYGNSTMSLPAALRVEGFHDFVSMNQPRQNFSAVKLASGKVLVAGGLSGEVLSSAEIYDTTTDRFTATDDLGVGRQNFTMTLLLTGQVLVAGGQGAPGGGTPLASAELYDPPTASYVHTGLMTSPRYRHTATLLGNGKVLLVGGLWGPNNRPTALATAELYDPATGLFTPTGSMNDTRYYHTATLLGNGKVLVAGGYGASGVAIATAEIFDPGNGTFASTGNMTEPRYGQTANALQDGTVLVAGGFGSTFLASAEIFDPAAGTFLSTGEMAQARRFQTATRLLDGRVFVAGGLGASAPLASAEIYDPINATWSSAGSMSVGRYYDAAVLLDDGEVLVMGGWTANNVGLASAVEYCAAPPQ